MASTEFSIVLGLTNPTASTVNVSIACDSDSVSWKSSSLAAGAFAVVELSAKFAAPGAHQIAVNVYPAAARAPGSNPPFLPPERGVQPLASVSDGVVIAATPLTQAVATSVGPNEADHRGGTVSEAGVTHRLAGDSSTLFIVSKTAGVWRSSNHTRWEKLSGPSRAFSITKDPASYNRLIVGERSDDVSDERLGTSGVWESTDLGTTWTFLYDPVVDTGSQAVPAVVISPQTGALFMATRRGVARWGAPQNPQTVSAITFPPSATGNITALAMDSKRVWARTGQAILHSDDDGQTWSSEMLPAQLSLPTTGILNAVYDNLGAGGNDADTLAAFDDEAYVIFKPDTSKLDKALSKYANLSPLLIFRPDQTGAARWTAEWTRDGDGRGLGGTRFVHAYHLPCAQLPDVVGFRRQVFYSASEGIQQALGEEGGVLTFDRPQIAKDALPSHPPGNVDGVDVHSDWWDFLLSPPTCKMAGQEVWASTDGGVYKSTIGSNGRLAGAHWETHHDGLATHNLHALIAIPRDGGKSPFLAYPSPDNGAWYRDKDGKWQSQGFMGDANFIGGDGVTPLAYIWRALWNGGRNDMGVLTGFGNSFPGSDGGSNKRFALYRDVVQPSLDGPTRIQAITPNALQSVASRALDVAMLIRAPLRDAKGKPIVGRDSINNVWPQPDPPRPILIRNPRFAEHPDASADKFKDWYFVSSLPDGATRVWPTGGVVNPRYYVQAAISPGSPTGLFVLEGANPRPVGSGYELLPVADDSQGPEVSYGPIYVNPLEPDFFVAAFTRAGVQQVGYSRDGGVTMCADPTLTALLTNSGRYPVFSRGPAQRLEEVGSRYHGQQDALVPVGVGFDRTDPTRVVIASPYGKLLTAQISTQIKVGTVCEQPTWLDISPSLYRVDGYLSAVQIANGTLFIGTQGQGVLSINDFTRALVATWVEPRPMVAGAGAVAVLHDGHGDPLPWAKATVALVLIPGGTASTSVLSPPQTFEQRSNEQGEIFLPATVSGGTYAVTMHIASDGVHAGSMTKFLTAVKP